MTVDLIPTDTGIASIVKANAKTPEVINMADDLTKSVSPTPIQQFYSGTSVFVTGGTGFLGKILVEKLLRSCPEVRGIYLLVRAKKGKNMHTRVEEIFDDPVFARLKMDQPKFRYKVHGIVGDCSLPDLGISDADKKILISEISIVFHVAATVRFDEKLKLATAINVRAPQCIVRLGAEMRQLKAIVHVSTAYANCHLNTIDERLYNPPMDSRKLISFTDSVSDPLLEKITGYVLDKWPNTYAYTKAVAEDVIKQEGLDLPVGIFRPAIVISTYREPITGWIDNMYGPTGVSAGAGNGILRSLHCDSCVNANIVPVDMCVNALIASAWDVSEQHQRAMKLKKQKCELDIPVYNYVSSVEKPIEWGEFMQLTQDNGLMHPSVKALWYYCFTLNKSRFVHYLYVLFLHYLPALLVDGITLCVGRQPRLLKLYKKIHKFTEVISYFSTRNWVFTNNNVQKLWSKLNEKDQILFNFDMKQLDWNEFFKTYIKGVRVYLMKDPYSTIEVARRKWNKLFWFHQILKGVFLILAFRILLFLFQMIF